ncbi:hypothetical protein Tco_1447435, partial [Tanacetum coccineum]
GRKFAKAEPIVHKDPAFNELDDDAIDYMETKDAQDVGRTRYVVHEEKESAEKEEVCIEDALNTSQPKVSTDRPDEGTDKQKVSTDKEEVSTDRPDEGTVDQTEGRSATPTTPTPTPVTFGDDETIAQVLLNMSQAKALADDTLDYVDTENAQDMGRSRFVVHEEKEMEEKEVSTEDVVSTYKEIVSTDKEKVSTDRSKVSTDRSRVSTNMEEVSTDSPDEGTGDQTKGRSATPTTQTPTSTTFGDDETIAQVFLNMSQAKAVSREKEKGVELKDAEETKRPRPTSTRSLLTLKPLLKIDPKDKGKKKIEEEDESDTESEGILEAEKKFKQPTRDEEMARKMKREQFTIEEREKFLHDTIAAQRRFLAEQRAIAIRNRPLTRTRLRNQMMTYLKHVGNKKHSDLKNKTFEEIQALYDKVKRFNESFTVVGSTKDERKIKEMTEGAKDLEQKRLKKKVAKETPKKEDTA